MFELAIGGIVITLSVVVFICGYIVGTCTVKGE